MPTGEVIRCTNLFKDLSLKIGDCVFLSYLIDINSGDLDVVLGMNWLGFYKAKIFISIMLGFFFYYVVLSALLIMCLCVCVDHGFVLLIM